MIDFVEMLLSVSVKAYGGYFIATEFILKEVT